MRVVLLWLLRHASLSIHRNLPCCAILYLGESARAQKSSCACSLFLLVTASSSFNCSVAWSRCLCVHPFEMVFVAEQGQRFTRADVDKEKHLDFGRHPRGPRAGSSSLHNCTIHGATSRPAVRLRLDTRVVELYGCQEHQATRALVRSE